MKITSINDKCLLFYRPYWFARMQHIDWYFITFLNWSDSYIYFFNCVCRYFSATFIFILVPPRIQSFSVSIEKSNFSDDLFTYLIIYLFDIFLTCSDDSSFNFMLYFFVFCIQFVIAVVQALGSYESGYW